MRTRRLVMAVFIVLAVVSLSGCAELRNAMSNTKANLVGLGFTVMQYDNHGSQTLLMNGDNVSVKAYQSSKNEDGSQELTGALDITVDGNQIITIGNTLIFEEQGISRVAGYDEISEFANIYSQGGFHFIPFDRMLNDLTNSLGRARIIVVYSQLGQPIGVWQGESVYVEIPKDLPKFTRINIDGKALYLHRVNYTIIDSALIN